VFNRLDTFFLWFFHNLYLLNCFGNISKKIKAILETKLEYDESVVKICNGLFTQFEAL
jgi:hypothetical protein